MEKLYNKLKNYNLDSAIGFEENDRQFIALKYLWDSLKEKDICTYLSFIIANSIVCYQLSWKWEDYWEEFSVDLLDYLNSWKYSGWRVVPFFISFLPKSVNNKRFVNIKTKRIEKLSLFLKYFKDKEEFYYDNMTNLVSELALVMDQKVDAKTIVFAVKMFSYWARNCFSRLEYFPDSISIPIDSRLIKIFDKYSDEDEKIEEFYTNLSKKLNIPELHLDWIIWNSNDLI